MEHDLDRRSFLKLPFAAAALALASKMRADGAPEATNRAGGGFRVGAREDRYGSELLIMGGKFDLKVSTQDSGGDLLIYDTVRMQRGGPALEASLFFPMTIALGNNGQIYITEPQPANTTLTGGKIRVLTPVTPTTGATSKQPVLGRRPPEVIESPVTRQVVAPSHIVQQ